MMLFDDVVLLVKDVNLCGCGGVGFFIGMKWFFVFKDNFNLIYFVVNGDEFELGMCKDMLFMMVFLYIFVEGVIIVFYVIKVKMVFIYICGEVLYVV